MRRAVSKILPSSSNSNANSNLYSNANANSNSNSNSSSNSNVKGPTTQPTSTSSLRLSSLGFVSTFKLDFHAIDEFYIQLDNPHKVWLPGDEVSGQIVLISKRNLANIVITLLLAGFVKINASSHSKLRPLKHTLFDHTIRIYGGETRSNSNTNGSGNGNNNSNSNSNNRNSNPHEFSNGLFKGEHVFPFIVKLPNKRIFTSIDFGKGSINYTLLASIGNSSSYTTAQSAIPTPPMDSSLNTTNISGNNTNTSTNNNNSSNSGGSRGKFIHNPSHTSEKLINLVNPVDVSEFPRPKPKRLILRDPRSTAGRDKKLIRTQSSTSTINTINTFATFSSNNSDQSSVDDRLSEAEHTAVSNVGPTSSISDKAPASINSLSPTIKVILDVPQRGYLRGESIPLKISINHLKKIQDLNGIIVTFVRVCRLDNGPDGVVESFRKDLQQLVLPLYVDPQTFKSEIQSSLRVPADAFPTITGCPLVSFQYFIEVLINLSGKSVVVDPELLAERPLPESGNSSKLQNQAPTSIDQFQFNFGSSIQSQKERSTFINTDRFKRSKKFLQITTEVCIGTHRLRATNYDIDNTSATHSLDSSVHNALGIGAAPGTLSRRSSLLHSNSNLRLSPTSYSNSPQNRPSPHHISNGTFLQTSSSTSSPLATTTPISASAPSPVAPSNMGQPSFPPQSLHHLQHSQHPSSNQSLPLSDSSSHRFAFNAIPESHELHNFDTPPYSHPTEEETPQYPVPGYNSIHTQGTPIGVTDSSAHAIDQNYSSAIIAASATNISHEFTENANVTSNLTEKERMQQHEESLLPSAPPDLDEELDAYESRNQNQEQIRHQRDMHEQRQRQEQQQLLLLLQIFNESSNTQVPTSHQFNFFSYRNSSIDPPTLEQRNQTGQISTSSPSLSHPNDRQQLEYPQPKNQNETQLHVAHAPSSSQLQQVLFNDDVIDHVPNYSNAQHDELVSSHFQNSLSSHNNHNNDQSYSHQ
ncbi:hypothetical protein LELG_01456 [Lodderomyces elongisporus NRRL YB-4239]|uniref:Arrestin C-terminal-like domain-containing protein n=1 Tax=Lodderomyces elongisporus (strain ATCC 11503 / CBS 2605 / JCM 1781 / NBRC 1676 / NRRL YB-4239) TaxID=379508 RepID=A5DVS0_LODEL|nr:hypothetical protein LELG_01456 [Lodderomyces elongisporus NRRL YB-4239]